MQVPSEVYDKTYYTTSLGGVDYHDREAWRPLFQRCAQRVVEDLHPSTVLDVGSAFGYIVEYLRDLGIEAWGVDISEYAIGQAREDIRQYLRVASATDPLPDDMPQNYDLVLNIEVLEHLLEEDGVRAIKRICSFADNVFFSSSGDDFSEPTHLNVQQPYYWAKKFAEQGFYKDLMYDTSYISKFSALFVKKNVEKQDLICGYEKALQNERNRCEQEQVTSVKLASDIEIIREYSKHDEQWFRDEISRFQVLNETVAAQLDKETELNTKLLNENKLLENAIEVNKQALEIAHSDIEKLANDMSKECALYQEKSDLMAQVVAERDAFYCETGRLKYEMGMITESRGYRLLLKWCRFRDWLLPKGSVRREKIKHLANRLIKKRTVLNPTSYNTNVAIPTLGQQTDNDSFYSGKELARQNWCRCNPIDQDVKFSIIVPLYKTPQPVLEAMIFSVKDQIYSNWELCLADASPECEKIRFVVEQLAADCDNRIKYRQLECNGGISDNTRAALELSTGDFICLLDHDDIIAPNALYEYAAWLKKEPDVDFFYSDKDMVNEEGTRRINQLFKPEYSPEIMFSANYLTHFCAIRRSVLKKTEGFDRETDGAQDWDIFFKVMEQSKRFKRIDQILYHWRIISTSVSTGVSAKPYVLDAQMKALNSYIVRRGWPGTIYFSDSEKYFPKVDWRFKEHPLVRVLVFSESGEKILDISGATEVRKIPKDSQTMIDAATAEGADVILFIDGDVCLGISDGLLEELSAWAMHPEVGFVAPQLRHEQIISSCGLVYDGNDLYDLFGGKPLGYYGQMGHSLWYRDLCGFRDACLAVERIKINSVAEAALNSGLPILTEATFRLSAQGLRNVYDHYAWAEIAGELQDIENLSRVFPEFRDLLGLPLVDSYFNSNCTLDVTRSIQLAPAAPTRIDKYSSDALSLASLFDFTAKDLSKNRAIVERLPSGNVKTMIWFLQEFDYVFYAGLYTIFRTADYLRREYGVQHTFAFVTGMDKQIMLNRIGAGFPELAKCDAVQITSPDDLKRLGNFDASVCTLWTTAYYSLKFNHVKSKFYFIQDFEPLFYPGGSTYAQTEATYRFGFYGICNTQGLRDEYEREYGGRGVSLDPSVDTKLFYPNPQRVYDRKHYTVFFYGRPGHPRNGFELGVQAMKLLKARMGDKVRIITAGADYDISAFGLVGVLENLGRLKIEETGDLYRESDAGLVMMFTRHPSYLPYEMMACGCCVVSNYNEYTKWFLKDGDNAVVCEASAGSIAEAIENVLLDGDRRRCIAESAARQIIDNNPTWDESLKKVAQFIQNPKINFN